MRLLLASLAVLLLACSVAHADEIADEADVLRVQLAESRAEAQIILYLNKEAY